MKIGLIDIDGHNFPNLPLMKISAWHKQQGDSVEWYNPLLSGHMNRVYMSKVFSSTSDYEHYVDADEVLKGGSGYAISLINGKEVYDRSKDSVLPTEIEYIYPDYSIYYDKLPEVRDTAYGFLTRGCPCNCGFCHVCEKEGKRSYKVADLSMFWNGQKNIVLLDPNITACKEWKDLFQQLIDSSSRIDFTQGLRIHMMTKEKAEMLKRIKVKHIHFAWDKYSDRDIVVPKFKEFRQITEYHPYELSVYVLINYDSTTEEDLERIYTLRDMGYTPYVMIYNKDDYITKDKLGRPTKLKPMHELLQKYTEEQIRHFDICWNIQRWVNNKRIFRSCSRFEDYQSVH